MLRYMRFCSVPRLQSWLGVRRRFEKMIPKSTARGHFSKPWHTRSGGCGEWKGPVMRAGQMFHNCYSRIVGLVAFRAAVPLCRATLEQVRQRYASL